MPANYDRPYPTICPSCGDTSPGPEHWKWNPHKRARFGGTWRCREAVRALGREYMKRRRADPVRSVKHDTYMSEYYQRHPNYQRYKAYRHIDNSRFSGGTLSWENAEPLMEAACEYCGLTPSNGLDRLDNTVGHVPGNVVPCCVVCNHILGDIPHLVKEELAEGLRRARAKGLLNAWVPPQFRK